MAVKQGSSQKSRTPKTSSGLRRGSKRQRPPELLLIAMDKGLAHRSKKRH